VLCRKYITIRTIVRINFVQSVQRMTRMLVGTSRTNVPYGSDMSYEFWVV